MFADSLQLGDAIASRMRVCDRACTALLNVRMVLESETREDPRGDQCSTGRGIARVFGQLQSPKRQSGDARMQRRSSTPTSCKDGFQIVVLRFVPFKEMFGLQACRVGLFKASGPAAQVVSCSLPDWPSNLCRWPSTFRPLREDVEPECRCSQGDELQCFLIAGAPSTSCH